MRTAAILFALACAIAVGAALPPARGADGPNLVSNGGFEEEARKGVPADWAAAGNRAIRQTLTTDRGRVGKRAAKLECTEFSGDSPDSHVMACQTGKVAVKAGRWYRFSFLARAEGIRRGAVDVGLVDTNGWRPGGLSEVFVPEADWKSYEFPFRAPNDVNAATSRLQFWFRGTGTLWLDEVSLVETEDGMRWFPQIPADRGPNLLRNASFECGAAGWGGFTWGLPGWGNGVCRLEGEVDGRAARHGRASLRLALGPKASPVYSMGWYDAVREPLRRVCVANLGWFQAAPGETFTLSAFLRADAEDVPALLFAQEAEGRTLNRGFAAGTTWKRTEFTFTPSARFFFVGAGLDLTDGRLDAASLRVDAVQLERGPRATEFAPRRPVEAFLAPTTPDGVFEDPEKGMSFTLSAYDDADAPAKVEGTLAVTDFFDDDVPGAGAAVSLDVPAHGAASRAFEGVAGRRRGSFRVAFRATSGAETVEPPLRCAAIEPVAERASPFGMNHAFPWDPLLASAIRAGVHAWRDWSAKWDVVEHEKGRFDFSVPDAQVERILRTGGRPLVLLPFPSAAWSSTADPAVVAREAGRSAHLLARLPMAAMPKDPADFGRYAAACAKHFGAKGVRAIEILNEPLYTDYALPRTWGYALDDYLRLLKEARDAIRKASPACLVVGGIGSHPEADLTREFVAKGGLDLVDVMDVHLYDAPRPAESYEETFKALLGKGRARDGRRRAWITEWGCYADDDPASLPLVVGDPTSNRCRFPSERAQAEHVVKLAALGLAYGVEGFFLHAGVSGTVNGSDAAGVLFEHGGAPRKVYAAIAAFVRLADLPPMDRPPGSPPPVALRAGNDDVIGVVFARDASSPRAAALVWAADGKPHPLARAGNVAALDLMGNPLPGALSPLTSTPVWLVVETGGADALSRAIPR